MTAESSGPSNQALRRARVRPEHQREYPVNFLGQWFRVLERHDPDVPASTTRIWVDAMGGAQHLPAAHFEIAERAKRLILVVDDDAVIRRTLQAALNKAGHDVLQAGDGEEALQLWHEAGPDLIITDIHMPKKSGLLLIEELQANGSFTPIIAMSDGGPTGNLTLLGMAKMLGSVRTVPKPYSLDQMVKAVNEELSR